MKEDYFRRQYSKRWVASVPDGVTRIIHRIPDSPGPPLPGGGRMSTGKRPFDSFGVESPGMAYAFEFKIMNGGVTFSIRAAFKGREHQLLALRQWHDAGGIALVVLGWVPHGSTRSQTFEIPISDINEDSRFSLPDLTDQSLLVNVMNDAAAHGLFGPSQEV